MITLKRITIRQASTGTEDVVENPVFQEPGGGYTLEKNTDLVVTLLYYVVDSSPW